MRHAVARESWHGACEAQNEDAGGWTLFASGVATNLLWLVDAQNVRVDLEETMGGLGLCSTIPGVRVLLGAGGRLSKRVEVSARAQKLGRKPKTFTLSPSSPIAPGTYTLVVDLPLFGNPGLGQPERLEVTGLLEITPR